MEQKELDLIVDKVEKDAGAKVADAVKHLNSEIDKKYAEASKGLITKEQLETFVKDSVLEVQDEVRELQKKNLAQGIEITELKESGAGKNIGKSLEEVLKNEIKEKKDQIKSIFSSGAGVIELDIRGATVKTAGSTSIGNTILPMNPAAPNSPYLPGIGGAPLETFGIIYNPNFIWNYVNRGRTDMANLAWANQTSVEGAAAAVQEGAPKPLWDTKWIVEFSKAKKIAVMTTITEEFDQDLPGFTTIVKRLMDEEVMRKTDDALYAAVIAIGAAQGYNITGLNGRVRDPNIWDALRAGRAQINKNNYSANLYALNPVTAALADMTKDAEDRYNVPPFLGKIPVVEANKVAENYALVADMTQYNVDIYKDMVIKVGWNNDDFQRNQFSVVAEIRYHDYISSNRKNALAYFNLQTVIGLLDSGS